MATVYQALLASKGHQGTDDLYLKMSAAAGRPYGQTKSKLAYLKKQHGVVTRKPTRPAAPQDNEPS